MADDDDEAPEKEEGESGGDGEEAGESKGKGKAVIIIAAALLLVVGGAAGAYFTGLLDPLLASLSGSGESAPKEEAVASAPQGTTVFYDLPEILVNLNNAERRSTFLKLRVSLELGSQQDVPKVEALMPRIIDNFQVYLRELRVEDLKGSAGMYRLREELLTRVAAATAPARVNDVLFKEMLVQ
jgi:flagellar FliL protein